MLRFSPTAWAKLVFFRDHGDTEIGGFGITPATDLLFIEDFITVKQKASLVSIAFDDEAVADFFDSQVDAGRKPEQFARIWLHTHPGDSPNPTEVDEETFERVFRNCDWAVMFVLGQGEKTYSRLRFSAGPGGSFNIPVKVDYRSPFPSSDHQAWKAEYETNIKQECLPFGAPGTSKSRAMDRGRPWWSVPEAWRDDLEQMEPEECRSVLQEFGFEPWNGDFQEDEEW